MSKSIQHIDHIYNIARTAYLRNKILSSQCTPIQGQKASSMIYDELHSNPFVIDSDVSPSSGEMVHSSVVSENQKGNFMRKPIRCFEGSARPHEPFWRIRNAAESESGEAEIELYGIISEYSWFEDDITPKMFKDDLYSAGNQGPVTIRINSDGGDVIAASVMRAIIQDYPGNVTARIDGLAASAAVVVALAADHIKIQDTAYMMIHDPAIAVFFAYLDIRDLDGLSAMLKSVRSGILDTYAARTGISEERLKRMMEDETWMSANEAVKFGFADEVIGSPLSLPATGGDPYDTRVLNNYLHVPAAVLNRITQPEEETAQPEESEEIRRLRDEVRILK